MKGKVLSLKIILSMLLILTAGFCFATNSVSNNFVQEKKVVSTAIFLGQAGSEEEFSALFTGDIIFSAEKVKVGSVSELDGSYPENKTFIGEYDEQKGENKKYVFQDLPNDGKNKTVIDNGEFVKLDNIFDGENYHIDGNSSVQEAIMISFGSYVYDDVTKEVKIAKGTNKNDPDLICANISLLNVIAEKDGKPIAIPSVRSILTEEGPMLDFVFLIKQSTNNEGRYSFKIDYMAKNKEYSANFEFSLVNNTSYTQNANPLNNETPPKELDYGYNAKPTLGWLDNADFEKTDVNFNNYYIGKSGIKEEGTGFPTLTYDYTKYRVSYEHTANRKNTSYQIKETITGNNAQLQWKNNGTNVGNPYTMLDYKTDSSINLVTILFTEPGTYIFSYEYLHDGRVINDFGFEKGEIKLAIFGLNAYYSKANYEGAKLQYFNIAKKADNHVDLIITNGYKTSENISADDSKKLGFVYNLVESEEREGTLLKENSFNALINDDLKSRNQYTEFEIKIKNLSNESFITNVLNSISYVQTNQGSMWIEGNDVFTDESFYFYSNTKPTFRDLFEKDAGGNLINSSLAKEFTNTSSFNKKGYYIVCVQVAPSGEDVKIDQYWQIFAFQYTSSAVDIALHTMDDQGELESLAGGKYTNKPVQISWKIPGIFDRSISGYYYSSHNNNLSKEDLLNNGKLRLTTTEKDGYYIANLGSLTEVPKGNFVKYLISIESEGESATYKMFTVDRQDISGVQAYLVETMFSGTSAYYTYATKNDYIIPITNAVTDGLATLQWDDKRSGAEITAQFSYTPFSLSSEESKSITGNESKEWILTNYQLGTTIVGSELKKSDSIYNVESDCILFNQGVYLITLKDSAGNECLYSFVIDRTANYFKLNNSIPPVTNTSKIYGDDINYSVGDYKAFKLNLSTANEKLKEFVEKAATSNLNSLNGYYSGINNNKNAISALFQKLGNDYYFTIKNEKVVAYKTDNTIDTNITNLKGSLIYVVSGEGYYKRTVYVIGANSKFTTNDVRDNSYVTLTINKDNARGMVYYSDSEITNIPATDDAATNLGILDYGSDTEDGTSGLIGARATSAKNIIFTWNMGTGNFEVQTVSYKFYSLKAGEFQNDTYKFYGSPEEFSIYNSGKWLASAGKIAGGNRAFVQFNGASNDSKAGLYIVTRKYKEVYGADLGDDSLEKNYWFIVDRNGIIQNEIGNNIRIELFEHEKYFNNFSTQNADYEFFSNNEDKLYNERYYIYLSTTKLPATLNIPVGKYFVGKNQTSADYFAGKLNVSVYFNDIENQLTGEYKGGVHKIYGSNEQSEIVDGCFNVDIYDYLTNAGKFELRDRISLIKDGNWLFLPGHYIVRITDNVLATNGKTHSTVFAFEIAGVDDLGPQIEVSTGYDKNDMYEVEIKSKGLINNNHFEYSATVSQEYLKINLPKYNNEVVKNAQVDQSYLVVTYGEKGTENTYINHPYEALNGIVLNENKENLININADGSIDVLLNTFLRDASGNIVRENINKSLTYKIKIRYIVGIDGDTRYKDCYVRYNYNGEKQTYYDATYTIVIDRIAPSQNIENLNANDKLVNDYVELFEVENMFESDYHDSGSNLYFTKQYSKYYRTDRTEKGYIYVYQVSDETAYTTLDKNGNKDIVKIYQKLISADSLMDLKSYNLTLPITDLSGYTEIDVLSGLTTYAGLDLMSNNYYEILEMDAAGNVTQYVIHYEPATDTNIDAAEITIPTKVTTTTGNVNAIHNVVYDYEKEHYETENNNKINDALNIYSISQDGEIKHLFENYFKIELSRVDETTPIKVWLTTISTDFNALTTSIVETINKQGSGSFYLKIITRTEESVTQINLYDKNNVILINILDLIVVDEYGSYSIDLNGANRKKEENGLWYFATEITIKDGETIDIYRGALEGDSVAYYKNGSTTKIPSTKFDCKLETTYQISMLDSLGNISNHMFNSSGYEFDILTFEKDFFYDNTDGIYYGFTDATLKYDTTIYSAKIWEKTNAGNYTEAQAKFPPRADIANYNKITINAIFNQATGEGGFVQVRIDLYNVEDLTEIKKSYLIAVDTRLSKVALRDASSGERQDIISFYSNMEYNDPEVQVSQVGAGYMNLVWDEIEENSYFNYEFKLHEMLVDNSYKVVDLTGRNNYGIATQEGSKGIYKFEIAVYSKDGKFVGNRIFAFEVQKVSTEIYIVRTQDGEAVFANSSFSVAEFKKSNTEDSVLSAKIKEEFIGINENVDLPLYVTNQDLNVVVTMQSVIPTNKIVEDVENSHTFTIYKFTKTEAYSVYIGILKIFPRDELVSSVSVGTETAITKTSFTTTEKNVALTLGTSESYNALLSKNNIFLDVYYMDKLVESKEYNYPYEIKGNGEYSFKVRDLAGNVHEFKQDEDGYTPNSVDFVKVYALREVVVLVNGEAPVENAFYNSDVQLVIYQSMKYVTGSVKIEAERNGIPYVPVGYNPYGFTDFGTYRVVVSANYTGLEKPLTKVVTFTILNSKEARQSIDLTSLSGNKITKALNPAGEDVTNVFSGMIDKMAYSGGLNLSYEDIMENADDLNVTSGKISFTLTYEINDNIYPTREVSWKFTLNNEIPKIQSTLKTGEKTTKGFEIYFNPSIIYEQVGESYILINDEIVAYISEGSINDEVRIETTFKKNGDGDYYIRLVSSSGVVLDSYKVTIKEPLNTWAIIVIIVIVGVVLTVAITIIVLRRKMRIR